jgi:hypothetical protein
METISRAAENEINQLLVNWWVAVNQQLAAVTGSSVQIGDAPVEMLYASEIGQRLVRIATVAEAADAAAAAGSTLPWNSEAAREIVEDCRAFEAWLNQTPITHKTPEEFWATPVGYMVLRALVWAEQDKLISLSEAAEQSGMSLSVLSQRISRGQIMGYRDPFEKNPQRARRIRLSDLNLLLNEGIVRKPFTTTNFVGQGRLGYQAKPTEVMQKPD